MPKTSPARKDPTPHKPQPQNLHVISVPIYRALQIGETISKLTDCKTGYSKLEHVGELDGHVFRGDGVYLRRIVLLPLEIQTTT